MNSVSRCLSKVSWSLKKHSPEILIAAGVVGTVISAVMACKATTKVSEILYKTKEDIDAIHDCMADESLAENYAQEDGKKDLVIVYAQTSAKLIKLYAPALALGVLSLGSILASNNIMRKRNVALAAAYATIDTGFKEYRGRVVEKFGEEIDRELKYNIKAKQITETVIDENGEEKNITKTINVAGPNEYSDYARFFDEGSVYWEKNSEYNLMFLRAEQNFANDRLRSRGYMFLNEIYDRLGLPITKAGQAVGWVYNPENLIGDNCVDFGIYDTHREKARDFVNGYERVILLDFNVDGNILDLI